MEIITFKYNNKIYDTPNLEKKLKRMKITINDIEIIDDIPKKEIEEDTYFKKYYYKNIKTGYTIVSIYPELPKWIENKDEWINV